MLTGPTIWSYLQKINTILHDNPQPHEERDQSSFWARSFDIIGDATLVYRCYLDSLERFEVMTRGLESRLAIKDITQVTASTNSVEIDCSNVNDAADSEDVFRQLMEVDDEGMGGSLGVQNITFRSGEYAEGHLDHDWAMDCGDMEKLTILALPEPANNEVARLLTLLTHEVHKAVLFYAEAPSHWKEDMESSRRLGVWDTFNKKRPEN